LVFFALFVSVFVAYPLLGTLMLFVLIRILHGLTFGILTTTGNTLIVDIMPSSRRGEGLGYFGISGNLAMAVGPMIGLMMLDSGCLYRSLFYTALCSGIVGFLFAVQIKAPKKPKMAAEPLSLDRFFLKKGLMAGVCLMLLAIPYGLTTSYLALYAKDLHIQGTTGLFFSLMAVGLIVSRIFSGKLIDQGKMTFVITTGQTLVMMSFLLFGFLGWINPGYNQLVSVLFFVVSIFLGIGYGMIFPAYNTLFVDLAPNNRRATASSTYLTTWDLGIGLGLVLGGSFSDWYGFSITYIIGTILVLSSTVFFYWKVGPHFEANKLR
jgi:MFS family permease